MQIEYLKIRNYKVFQNVEIANIPSCAVFVGRNGAGKTTFFDIFGFLHDCLKETVRKALDMRGGFNEVVSRNQPGPIGITIKFREEKGKPLITYELEIDQNSLRQPFVKKERLYFRRGSGGAPWLVLDFSNGKGKAAAGDLKSYEDVKKVQDRPEQVLDSPATLAIKGLGQFKEFEAIANLRRLIEDWQVFDFHINEARSRQQDAYSESLSSTGENLVQVTKYLRDTYPEQFQKILRHMTECIPGISQVNAVETADHYVVLQFKDEHFKNPFSARFVSDGTMKMFTYMVLLNNPERHALLCIEEPENQLYPELLMILAEEFRLYSLTGGQVFISTHSPDFLDAIQLEELFCIVKQDGYSTIRRVSESPLIQSLVRGGDLPGSLWNQGILMNEMVQK